jgi:hypothetical protein
MPYIETLGNLLTPFGGVVSPMAGSTGGSITIVDGYRIHQFTTVGASTFTPSASSPVEILVVAGGGSGGIITGGMTMRGAGGGAGGLIYIPSFPVVGAANYTVTVGAGGNSNSGSTRNQGANTTVVGQGRTLTALGGGMGAMDDSTDNATTGGSGGGSWYPGYVGKAATQPSTTNDGISTYASSGFGNKGGDSGASQPYGGGGGGAGAAGNNFNSAGGPVGGIGRQYSISGTATYYAGGGGAAGFPPQTESYAEYLGGLGGGGKGSNNSYDILSNGAENTGGGGGSGGSGGSGIVIIRYKL